MVERLNYLVMLKSENDKHRIIKEIHYFRKSLFYNSDMCLGTFN